MLADLYTIYQSHFNHAKLPAVFACAEVSPPRSFALEKTLDKNGGLFPRLQL
jgi:hypothetical protein